MLDDNVLDGESDGRKVFCGEYIIIGYGSSDTLFLLPPFNMILEPPPPKLFERASWGTLIFCNLPFIFNSLGISPFLIINFAVAGPLLSH